MKLPRETGFAGVLFSRQWRNANATIFHHGKISRPIISTFNRRDRRLRDVLRRRRCNAKKNNSAQSRQSQAKRQLTKIFIERDHDTIFTLGAIKNLDIANARRIGANPRHVVAVLPQSQNGIARKIFICQ